MSHQTISVGMKLTPPAVTLGVPCTLTLSATLSPSHTTPITIYTRQHALNNPYSQDRGDFFCTNLSDDAAPIRMRTKGCTKNWGGISREAGGKHDHLFHTLEPGRTVNFTAPFLIATDPDSPLKIGQHYRLGVDIDRHPGQSRLKEWLPGRREEVMSKPGEESYQFSWGQENFEMIMPDPIEFEVIASPEPGLAGVEQIDVEHGFPSSSGGDPE